ncbi:hypothetical protein C9994_03920 [Marivirga lumbricoides]|uniref:Uncharacterized protein n=1 Tax=Marivirga lumbricoides TaxID=1046115 RepID=A0A2T4DTW5_9BACT|nr:hypothetical protein C9994_03920 [Marivirga lumbricoides]
MILITLSIYSFIIFFTILEGDFSFRIFFLFTLTYLILVGIGLSLRYHSTNSHLDDTVIFIKEDQIIREGKYLRKVRIFYNDISDIKDVKYGIILFDKNFSKFKSSFSINPEITDPGLIFIPKTMENFEEIKKYVVSKIN